MRAMSDIHDKIRSELERRLAIARAASPGPWMAATHTGRKDGVSLVGRVEDRGTGKAVAVFAGADVHQRANDAEHTALHDPADSIRRYEYAQKVLTRHATKAVWNGGDLLHYRCDFCGRIESPACDDVADLAESLGIDTGGRP